jgi:hypothetical protein
VGERMSLLCYMPDRGTKMADDPPVCPENLVRIDPGAESSNVTRQ